MLTCKGLLSQQWGGSQVPTAVLVTGPENVSVGSGVERWVRCAWSNDALCQLLGGDKQDLEDQSLLLRLLSSSTVLQAAVLDQLKHLARAPDQPLCPMPQVFGPLDSNSLSTPGPLFTAILPCFLTEANSKGQSWGSKGGGRLERIRFGCFSSCLGVSSSSQQSDIRVSAAAPAYDATPALLLQWHLRTPPILPLVRSGPQPRLDSYGQSSQLNRAHILQQHSIRGYHDPRNPYPSKVSDPSGNGRVGAPTGDGSATNTSDACASPCHPPSSLNTPGFSSIEQLQSPVSTLHNSPSTTTKQQLVSPAEALRPLRLKDAPSVPDAQQPFAAKRRPDSSNRVAAAAVYDGGQSTAAAGSGACVEASPESEEGCADIPRSLREQRNSLVLAVVPLAVTIFSLPGGAILHQNAASIEYYGERTTGATGEVHSEGLKQISYHELLSALTIRTSVDLGARQRQRQSKALAGATESPRHGWDPVGEGAGGKEAADPSTRGSANGEGAQEEDVLQQLFELDTGKMEQMLAMVLRNEGEIWQGILRVPATLQPPESDADDDDCCSEEDGNYGDMYAYISGDEITRDKSQVGYHDDVNGEGAVGQVQAPPSQVPMVSGAPHSPVTTEIALACADRVSKMLEDDPQAHYHHHHPHYQGNMIEVTSNLRQRIRSGKHAAEATVATGSNPAAAAAVGDRSSTSAAAGGATSPVDATSGATFSFQKSAFERTSTAQPIPGPSGSESSCMIPQPVLTSVSAAPGGQLEQDRASPFTLRLSRLLVRKDSIASAAAAAAAAAAGLGISYRSSSCVIESMTSPDKEKSGGQCQVRVASKSLAAAVPRHTFARLQLQSSPHAPIDTVGSGEWVSGEGMASGGGQRHRGLSATVGGRTGGRGESTEPTTTDPMSLSNFTVEWTRTFAANTTASLPPDAAPTPLPLVSLAASGAELAGLVSGHSAPVSELTLQLLAKAATTTATAAAVGDKMNVSSQDSNPSHGDILQISSSNLGRGSGVEARSSGLPNDHNLPVVVAQQLPGSGGSSVPCAGSKVGNSAPSAGSHIAKQVLSPAIVEDIDGMGAGRAVSAANNTGSAGNCHGGILLQGTLSWQRSSIGHVSSSGPPNNGTRASFCPAVPEESGSLSEAQLSRKTTAASSNPQSGAAGVPNSATGSKALLASMSAACKPLTQGLLSRFLSYALERRLLTSHHNDKNNADRRREGRGELQNTVMSATTVSAPRSRRSLRAMLGVTPKASTDEQIPRQASEEVAPNALGEHLVQRSTQSCGVSSRMGTSPLSSFGAGGSGALQDSAASGMGNAATQSWRPSSARRALQTVSGRPSFHVTSGTSLMQATSSGPRRAMSCRRASFSAARRSLHVSQGPLATSTWQVLISAHNDNDAAQAASTAAFSPTCTSPGNTSSHGGSNGTAQLMAAAHALTAPAPSVPSVRTAGAVNRAAITVMPNLDIFGSSDPAVRGSGGAAAVNSLFSSMQGGYSSHIDMAASMQSMLLVTATASNNPEIGQLEARGSTRPFNFTTASTAPAVPSQTPAASSLLSPASPFTCRDAQTIVNLPSAGRPSHHLAQQQQNMLASQAQPRQSMERLRQSMEQPRKSMERPRRSMEYPRRSMERSSLDQGYQVANVTVAPATAGGTLGIPGVESEGDLVLLKILASDEEAAAVLATAGGGGGDGGTSGCTLPTTNPHSNPWSSVMSSFRFGGSGHTTSILSPSPMSAALTSSNLPTSTATGRSTATAATGITAPAPRSGLSTMTTGGTVMAPTLPPPQKPPSSASPRARPPSRVLAFAARLRTAPQPLATAPASANLLTGPSVSAMNSFNNGNIMASTGAIALGGLTNDNGSRGESYTGLDTALGRSLTQIGLQQRCSTGLRRKDKSRAVCRKSMSSAALGDMVRQAGATAAVAAASSSTSAAFQTHDEAASSYSSFVAAAAAAMVTADSSISHDDSARHQLLLSPSSNDDGGSKQADAAAGNGKGAAREYRDGVRGGNRGPPRSTSGGSLETPQQQQQRRPRRRPRRSQHQQQSSPQLQRQRTEQPECWHEVCVTAVRDPGSGSVALVVVQQDVSDKVVAERHLQQVAEVEHRLLEQIFPRHVLQYITEESVVPAQSPPPANTQLSVGPDGATISGPPSVCVAAATSSLEQGSTSSLTAAPSAAFNISALWRPQIRDCNCLATWHPKVTVLFADIQGFTPMCKMLPPRVVMAFLNDLFTRFDAMLDTYRVYKVETIGDCYMVAGGLIVEDEDGMSAVRGGAVDPLQADDVFAFAQAMLRAASAVRLPTTGSPVSVRVGIHSGPVVSGVVGTRMPRFCLFGDTVNTASRMESTGVPGAIHVSRDTYDMLSGQPGWQPTGGIEVKGKGLMATYVWSPSNPTPTAVPASVALASSSLVNAPAAPAPVPYETPRVPSPLPSLPHGLALRSAVSAPVSPPCNSLFGGGGQGGKAGKEDKESATRGSPSGSLKTTISCPAPGRGGGEGREEGERPHRRQPIAMANAGKLLAQMEALARSITGTLEEGEVVEVGKEEGKEEGKEGECTDDRTGDET